jgi:DNA polymerase-1
MSTATMMPSLMYCSTPTELREALEPWLKHPPELIGLDLETTGLDPEAGYILLVQLSDGDRTVVVPAMQVPVIAASLRFLADHGTTFIAHNAKFEFKWIRQHFGFDLPRVIDTQIADWVRHCGLYTTDDLHEKSSLKACAERYLKQTLDKTLQTSFVDVDPFTFVPTPSQVAYAAEDARIVVPLWRKQRQFLAREDLLPTFELEMRLLPVIARMESRGVYIDRSAWEQLLAECTIEATQRQVALTEALTIPFVDAKQAILQPIHQARAEWDERYAQEKAAQEDQADQSLFGSKSERRTFINDQLRAYREEHPRPLLPGLARQPDVPNLGSRDQLQMALAVLGVTLPNLQHKTLQNALEQYPAQRAMLGQLLEWKGFYKLLTAFGEKLLERVDRGGRLHPEINQLVSTGRVSFRKPNLQQIPAGKFKRGAADEFAARFRTCFVAPPGRKLVCADYSSIEFRIAAELSGEQDVINELRRGKDGDPHKRTAALIFDIDQLRVQPAQREMAKRLNYGLMYGLGALGFAEQVGITETEAEQIMAAWALHHPRMSAWLKLQGEMAANEGYTVTAGGRKRYYERPDASLVGYPRERFLKGIRRQGKNAPIQGLAADIAKWALVELDRTLDGWDAGIVNYIHDEIVVECAEALAVQVAVQVQEEMISAGEVFLTQVPVEVEVKISDRWEH